MRKNLFYVFISNISAFGVSSCSDQDDMVFSCDESVNLWAKENIAEIREMNRAEWKTLPASKKRAAYVAFTPQQKISFWKEKLTNVMSMDWTKEEQAHIKLVYDFVNEHPDFFGGDGLTGEQLNVLDLFFYKWVDVAQNEFGWDMKLIAAIAAYGGDFEIDASTKGRKRVVTDIFDDRLDDMNSCHCNTGMLSDFCNVTGEGMCEDVKCEGSDWGCGWIWLDDCNGRCSEFL